ncbi:glutamate receptor ionotropic, kainate 2-like [Branchiostoma lanceolatum]|uniref:glutamate receptor ionotropic, kainate 2-like n=1 Tax=Branchiostoma lanceolatum TaxID=7740 RepID=UPI0034532ADC
MQRNIAMVVAPFLLILQLATATKVEECQFGGIPGEQRPCKVMIGGLFGSSSADWVAELALNIAVDMVNTNPELLPNVTISAVLNRTQHYLTTFRNIQNTCYQATQGIVAVIGPATTTSVKAVHPVCAGLQIPHIAPWATDPTLTDNINQYPYLVKMMPPDSMQSKAIAAFAEKYNWNRLALFTSTSDYGINGVREFQKIAAQRDWTIVSSEQYNPIDKPEELNVEHQLRSIRDKGVRVVILNGLAEHARVILKQAKALGMTGHGWAWVVTDGITSIEGLYDPCQPVPDHLLGIVGTRVSVGRGSHYKELLRRLKLARSQGGKGSRPGRASCGGFVDVYAYATFDSVMALAYGLHDFLSSGRNLYGPDMPCNVCEGAPGAHPWDQGSTLYQFIKQANGPGAVADISFNSRAAPMENMFDVVNLRKKGMAKVGEWSEEEGLTLDEHVVFMGGTTKVPVDSSYDLNNKTLMVTTILERPFIMIRSDPNLTGNDRFEGMCIDLLNELQKSLNFQYKIYLVPDSKFGSQDPITGEWNGLVRELLDAKADLAAATLTISYERLQVISFTQPYLDLGMSILMRSKDPKKNLFAFLDPFSPDLWIAFVLSMIVVSFGVWFCSTFSPYGHYGAHAQRTDPQDTSQEELSNNLNLWNSFWFAFSSWMQQTEVAPRSVSGRIVGGLWWMAVTVIIATYTANLAAFLTVARMSSGINSVEDLANQKKIPYGTVSNSQPESFFEFSKIEHFARMFDFMTSRNTFVETSEEGIQRVHDPNDDYAFIWDSAVLDYEAEQEPCEIMTVGRLFGKIGYGFGLPMQSLYTERFSLEIMKLRKSGEIDKLKRKWYDGPCKHQSSGAVTTAAGNTLDFKSMAGVFYCLFGGVMFGCIVVAIEWCVAAHKDVHPHKPERPRSFCEALRNRMGRMAHDIRENWYPWKYCCRRKDRPTETIIYDKPGIQKEITLSSLLSNGTLNRTSGVVRTEDPCIDLYSQQNIRPSLRRSRATYESSIEEPPEQITTDSCEKDDVF